LQANRLQKLDLLILLPSRQVGGAEHYAALVAKTAAKRGWRVGLVLPYASGMFPMIEDLTASGVGTFPFNTVSESRRSLLQPFSDAKESLVTLWLLIRNAPRTVILVLPRQDLLLGSQAACAILGIAGVVVFQLAGRSCPQPPRKRRLYDWCRQRGARWVAVSHQNASVIADSFGCPASELQVIYNGTAKFELTAHSSPKSRAALGLASEGGPILLSVGRLSWQKGFDLLLHALPFVLRKHPHAHCFWAGEGELEDALQAMVQSYELADHVTFLGQRHDVPELIKACDLFVFPSREEGHPFALLEAMSAGAPIVSSDTSGIPEIITSGTHGLLHRTEDACDLLDKLVWALENPHSMRQMANRAFHRASEFSEERMLGETFALIEAQITGQSALS
jgi:glycosyltransferase involved in cell wall biosynthesis